MSTRTKVNAKCQFQTLRATHVWGYFIVTPLLHLTMTDVRTRRKPCVLTPSTMKQYRTVTN